MPQHPRTLDHVVFIASAILGIPEVDVRNTTKVGPAESALNAAFAGFGDFEAFPDAVDRAAITCSRFIANHPLIDGNKRCGVILLEEMLDEVNVLLAVETDEEYAATIESLAAGELTETSFVAWVRAHATSVG